MMKRREQKNQETKHSSPARDILLIHQAGLDEEDQRLHKRMKQDAFIEAYKSTFGNVTEACKAVGIERFEYYGWLEKDVDFKRTLYQIEPSEQMVDAAESALMRKIEIGDTPAILFTLKTKGKHRGYVEKQEIEHKTTEDYSKLALEELKQLHGLMRKARDENTIEGEIVE